ncbi:hypothetical protein DXG01_003177 [Tephrocybe rancida]|nr:hypothetical protein DXG01_003177 [Tephrocybe rancida]
MKVEHNNDSPLNDAMDAEPPPLIKDSIYFMDMLTFKVEDHLFRVPANHFTTSTFFAPYLESSGIEEKKVRENIIELKDATPAEFRTLLKLIYPIPPYLTPEYEPMMNEWLSIMKLSTQWLMLDIRRKAIKALTLRDDVPPADRVVLARKYSVDNWARCAYAELAQKASSMSQADITKIGLSSAIKVYNTRERVFGRRTLTQVQLETLFKDQVKASPRNAVERLLLARRHNVAEWLREGFIELVRRSEHLTLDEGKNIGFKTAVRLYRARERFFVKCAQHDTEDTGVDELMEEPGTLKSYGPVDRVALAKQHGVLEWVREALDELTVRQASLTLEEAQALGYDTAIRLAIARERHTKSQDGWEQPNDDYTNSTTSAIATLVDEELGNELSVAPQYGIVDRALKARKAGVDEWLQSALVEMVQRPERVSDDEAIALGMETGLWVCQQRMDPETPYPRRMRTQGAVNSATDQEFKTELHDIREAAKFYHHPEDENERELPRAPVDIRLFENDRDMGQFKTMSRPAPPLKRKKLRD